MERRQVLMGAMMAPAVTLLPRAAWAGPASSLPIEWEGAAADSRFAPLVGSWIIDKIKAGVLYCRDEFRGRRLTLSDPSFKVVAGCPVWNWMTGDTKENGLAIYISEMGVPVTKTKVITSIGYESYFAKPEPRDMERYPDYFVKQPWLSYDESVLIEPHMPKDHIGCDNRWIDAFVERNKKETTTP